MTLAIKRSVFSLASMILLTVSSVGCDEVLPYEPGVHPDIFLEASIKDMTADSGAPDGSPDQAPTNDAARDASAPDAPPTEGGPLEASSDDASDAAGDIAIDAQPDLLFPDAFVADACVPGVLTGPSGACIDTESGLTNICAGACAPLEDLDCDGLRAGALYVQDFWPLNRNVMLFGDGFKTAYKNSWNVIGSPTQDLAAGTLTLLHGDAISLTSKCAGQFATPDNMTEMKFKIDAINNPTSWFVMFQTSVVGPKLRACKFGRDSYYKTLPGMTLSVVQTSTTLSRDPVQIVSVSPGDTFIIQAWSTLSGGSASRTHRCRLLDKDGKTELIDISMTSTQTLSSGKIDMHPTNVNITVDYIRSYKL